MLYLLAIPAAVPAAGAVYLGRLPKDYSVRRSLIVKADRQAVFDKVRDTPSWGEWSPWLLHEPDAKLGFSADADQAGGSYSWDGRYIGAGTLTGSYDFLELAWHAAVSHARMRELKIDKRRPMLEVYENDPTGIANSNELRTALYMPLR